MEYLSLETIEKTLRQYADQKHSKGDISTANGILTTLCRLEQVKPTADVKEVVRGKWIEDKGVRECSNCAFAAERNEWGEVLTSEYCSSCGADMRGVE